MEKVDVLSGIQPTGSAHVGNYLGAFKQWLELQESRRCFYCIVDLHALTTQPKAEELRAASFEMARLFLAIGLHPEKSALFIQSQVPGHADLAWILECLTPMGELARMTQFKDKAEDQKTVNTGLFAYPVLQAADILIYRAREVPVGEDQVQHLELTREISRRFNRVYKKQLLPEPKPLLSPAPRILGLDGTAKMSKSKGNHIPLLAEPKEIEKRVKTAVTDPQRLRRDDPGRPEVCNVFALHGHFSTPEEVEVVDAECRSAARGCVDCKLQLARNMADYLAPFRRRAALLDEEPDQVRDALADGARRARAVADDTMARVRDAVGIG